MSSVPLTERLERARAGDERAWDQAVAEVYSELKRIARRMVGNDASATLSPTGAGE
jgi:DNA-directed RNA polymerase specialized sigma24 family protein